MLSGDKMANNETNNKKGKASTKKSAEVKKTKTNALNKTTSNTVKKTKIPKEEKIKEEVLKEEKEIAGKKEKQENIKQARKQLYYNNNSGSDELSKLIKIVLIVTLIMIVFYGVTVVVTNKAKEAAEEKNKQAVEIQYDSIMIGSMLNIDGSYYVLIEDQDDIRLSEYTTLIQAIKANDDSPAIYTADLSSSFNENYLADESNYDSNMDNFKVTGTTLVRVSDHKITDVYDNYEAIKKKLDELD